MPESNKENLTWDLSPLFTGDDDPKIEVAKKEAEVATLAFVKKWQGREDYLREPAVLKEALDEYNDLQSKSGLDGGVGYYFGLRQSTDQDNPTLKAKNQIIHDFVIRLANQIQFFMLRVAKIPLGEQEKLLNFPALTSYKHLLERLFVEAKHLLSEPEEKILNLKADTASGAWQRLTANFIAKEEHGGKSFSEMMSLIDDRDPAVRDSAAAWLNQIFKKHLEVGEAELNAILQDKKINDELRGFSRPDQARHLGDDLETPVVDAMLEAVSVRFDLSKRFYALKAKLFGLPQLKYHERNLPYGEVDKKYSFAESVALVGSVLHKLDSDFGKIFDRFIVRGQVDVYPKKGKTSGAFCAGEESPTRPTYILLNHTDKLHDVLTLAHEVGHGINNELIKEKQNALNYGTPLATAEVASTFMEDFVLEKLAEESDEELRLALMMMKLNDDVSTIFRQVACYRFEQELHTAARTQGYLPKEKIGEIFQKHMASYMGEAVEISAGSENWWVYWSHIRSFFYVYSYASGLLVSKAMQNLVRQDKKFIIQVKEFLATGLADSPKNIFAKMGIKIDQPKFWQQGLVEIEESLLAAENLAKKLGKV